MVDTPSVVEGVRNFAGRAGAELRQLSELTFQASVGGDRYPALIGIEAAGPIIVLSYSRPCGALPDTSMAPGLLMKNWGGVGGTSFYLSVNVTGGQAWCFLETRQLLPFEATSTFVAETLAGWHLQCRQALEAMK